MSELRDRLLGVGARVWSAAPVWSRYALLHALNPRYLIGVVGVIRNPAGEVLVLRHRFRTPWAWGLPGGFIQRREALPVALARELREETGLAVTIAPAVLDVELSGTGDYLSVAFGGTAPEGTMRYSSEILDGGYFSAGALPEGMYPYHAALVSRIAKGERGT